MAEHPEIVRYRMPRPRVLNRSNINEYGLTIPSKKSEDYEPPMNNTAMLINFSKGLNYKKEARAKRNAAWKNYQTKRANAAKSANAANRAKNNTRRTLFGGRSRTAKKSRR